jgi:hypothetical protein
MPTHSDARCTHRRRCLRSHGAALGTGFGCLGGWGFAGCRHCLARGCAFGGACGGLGCQWQRLRARVAVDRPQGADITTSQSPVVQFDPGRVSFELVGRVGRPHLTQQRQPTHADASAAQQPVPDAQLYSLPPDSLPFAPQHPPNADTTRS